jgi:hypothetical protein
MIPVSAGDSGDMSSSATRVDNPLQSLKPESAAALFGRTTTVSAPLAPAQSRAMVQPGATAPEVGLTQHHLPDEENDPRLSMVTIDSERLLRFACCAITSSRSVARNALSSRAPIRQARPRGFNLALALRRVRSRVVPSRLTCGGPLATVFKFVPPWCFAEQLAAHRQQPMLPWSLVEIPGLWLHVAAINPRIEKTQLLDGPAFAIAVERLRLAGYDHIVVDAPPVLGSADVNLLADAADAVMMVVKSRQTTTRDLRRAIDQIGAAKVVGTVMV